MAAIPDSDDDLGEPVGPQLPAAASTNPFAAPSPSGSPVNFDAIMRQMMETTQAAVNALSKASSSKNSLGFADANKILNRPASFGSASHDVDLSTWHDWSHSFRTWLVFADQAFEAELQSLESNLDKPVVMSGMSEETAARSRRLYAILGSLVSHKPKAIVRQVADRSGFEAWRQLVNVYAPKSKVRSLALLNALMGLPAFNKTKTLREQIEGLERIATEYQRVSGSMPGEDILLGTLLRCLPSQVRSHIQLQMDDTTSYASVRSFVLSYEVTTTTWSAAKVHQSLGVTEPPSEPFPMEVDALTKGKGKGKGKGKSSKGKGKGDGKSSKGGQGKGKSDKGNQGKGKHGKGSKGKGKGSGKHQNPNPAASVICHNCQKPGHYARDCWSPKAVNQVETPRSPAPSSVGPSASQVVGASASQVSTQVPAVRRIEIDMTSIVSGGGSLNVVSQCEPLSASCEGFAGCKTGQACLSHDAFAHVPVVSKEFMSVARQLHSSLQGDQVHELRAIVPEHFDMAYSDADPDWHVPTYQPVTPRPEPLGFDPSLVRFRPEPFKAATRVPALQRFGSRQRTRKVSGCSPLHKHVCMVVHDANVEEEIEVVVDSGADASCLPYAWGHVGSDGGANLEGYRDAQGNPLHAHQTREAVISFGDVSFREKWLLSSVTSPLFCVGKLKWNIWHDEDDNPFLCNKDHTIQVPLFYRHNSLHARGMIRCVTSASTEHRSLQFPEHRPLQSQEHRSLQSQEHRPLQFQVPSSLQVQPGHVTDQGLAESLASSPAIRAIELYGSWFMLDSSFVEMAAGLYANKCTTDTFVDCTVALPNVAIQYRTTLVNRPNGWILHALNEDMSALERPEAKLEGLAAIDRLYEIITIASTYKVDIRTLFPDNPESRVEPELVLRDASDDDPMLPEGGPEGQDGLPGEEAPEQGEAAAAEAAAAEDDGDHPQPDAVVVDGIALSVDCTLATLRAAAQSLGLGKSGGKSTVLRRIREHLVRHNLLEQHRAHAEAEGRMQGREQRFVKEPSPEEIRLHQLTHLPYREWCSACVSNRARADRHERARSDERQCSTFSFDFCYTARSTTPTQKLVCLVGVDSHTGAQQAWPIPQKGGPLNLKYLCAEICRLLNYLGHSEATVKSDGEPTCLAIQKLVKAYRAKLGLKTHLEQPEPGDHQSNAAEHAVENLRQLTNTLLTVYESETDSKVSSLSPVHSWAWRHASFLQQRFSRSQGVSPFELALGRPYLSKLVRFGETVFGRVRSRVKGQPRWCKGVWLGKLSSSDGHIVFCAPGVFLACRSIRRLPQRYSASVSLFRLLRDNPYTQAAFLAGQMGQARPQKTQDPASSAQEAASGEPAVPGSQASSGVPAEVAAAAPGAVDLPLPFPGYILDDDAMLSELIPPVAAAPEPPTPVLDVGEPATPIPPEVAMPASVAPELGTDVAMASTPEPLGDPSGSSGLVPEAPKVGTRVGDGVPGGERKRLRLNAVTMDGETLHHADDDAPALQYGEPEADELCDYDHELEYEGYELDQGEIPSCLIRDFSEHEPQLSEYELAEIDHVAAAFEVSRLTGMGVMEEVEGRLDGHRTLSTKYVFTWRPKIMNSQRIWLRRARLVAREFAHLDPHRSGLFSPATSSVMVRVIPALYMSQRDNGWSLLAMDISDAYLTCSQGQPTVTRVGDRWFRLWKMLPGQRDGSSTWFTEFTEFLGKSAGASLMPEQPALFSLEERQGAGMLHVDDVMSTGFTPCLQSLEKSVGSKYKLHSEWILDIGDEASFLKRKHMLVQPDLLLIVPSVKHVDKLLELTGLNKAKLRVRKTPLPVGGLPIDKESDPVLDAATSSRYRSAIGVLLYLQSDLLECQFSIRLLSTLSHCPTVGAWQMLRHLVSYIAFAQNQVLGLSKPIVDEGIVRKQQGSSVLEVFTDSDWAGCRRTRRSVSACVIAWDSMVLHSSSRTQKSISLSSAESEYNSMVSGACDAILVKACINFVAPPECQVSEVSLFVDNSAARSIASRQGVGRTRHLEGKILWLQDKVKQGLFIPRPVPTADNVSDLGTKVLRADRVAYLLGKCNVRDLSCGNALVGKSQILDAEERYRIRRILSQSTVSTSQVLQVLAIALQVASAQGTPSGDDNDDDDPDSWMSLVVSLIGYALAFADQYPIALSVGCQIILLGVITCIMWSCLRPNPQVGEAGIAHPSGWQPRQNVQVHVNVGDRAFAKPLRGPQPSEEGLPAPGTPARPLRVDTDDEGDIFEVPSVQVRIPRGARSKAKASPSRAAVDPRVEAIGANDFGSHVPHEAGVGSNDPMPKAMPKPIPKPPVPDQQRVWVAPHQGRKFHKGSCSKALHMSMELVSYSRAEAIGRGYTPCKVCKP